MFRPVSEGASSGFDLIDTVVKLHQVCQQVRENHQHFPHLLCLIFDTKIHALAYLGLLQFCCARLQILRVPRIS